MDTMEVSRSPTTPMLPVAMRIPAGLSSKQLARIVTEVLNFSMSSCQAEISRNILWKAMQIMRAKNDLEWVSVAYKTSSTQTDIPVDENESYCCIQDIISIADSPPTDANGEPNELQQMFDSPVDDKQNVPADTSATEEILDESSVDTLVSTVSEGNLEAVPSESDVESNTDVSHSPVKRTETNECSQSIPASYLLDADLSNDSSETDICKHENPSPEEPDPTDDLQKVIRKENRLSRTPVVVLERIATKHMVQNLKHKQTKFTFRKGVATRGNSSVRSLARPYGCTACGVTFSLLTNLDSHMKSHIDENSLEEKKKSRTPKGKRVKCNVCNKTYSSEDCLKVHARIHTGIRPYKCGLCGKTFSRKSYLLLHIQCHTGDRPFQCGICAKRFYKKSDVHRHLRIHTGEKPFECVLCEMKYAQKSQLDLHVRIHHSRETRYACPYCGKRFYQSANLNIHVRSHTGYRPYKCGTCSRRFTTSTGLEAHCRIHTGEKPYQCSQCKKRFTQRGHLTVHLRMHSGEKPFKCTICGKAFCKGGSLRSHFLIHSRDRPFECSVCKETFLFESHLVGHFVQKHEGQKPFTCGICGKGFLDKNNLRRHDRVHSGEKLFHCLVCGRGFNDKSHLKRHESTHL